MNPQMPRSLSFTKNRQQLCTSMLEGVAISLCNVRLHAVMVSNSMNMDCVECGMLGMRGMCGMGNLR
jgi:hypothetical protein